MFAIVITIMVLELKVPHGEALADLRALWRVFLSYLLSFVHLGIYWNNHHHMLHACKRVTGSILWANLHLLFWLSLIPFTTGWMGENHFARLPTALYGAVLLLSGVANFLLQRAIIASQGVDSVRRRAVGRDWKGKVSTVAYAVAVAVALRWQGVALALFVGVALMWWARTGASRE